MLDAAAEREHNQMALDAKAQGAEIALIHPPLDEDEQKSAQVDDAVVYERAKRAMARKSAQVRAGNG